MSILANYASMIDSAGANLNNAAAQQQQILSDANRQVQDSLKGMKQTIQHSQELKAQKEQAQLQARAQFIQNQENAKTMEMLAIAERVGPDGKKIGTDKALEMVNAKNAQALAKYDASMPKNYDIGDIATMGVGALAAGGVKALKKSQEWLDKAENAIENTKFGQWVKNAEAAHQRKKDNKEIEQISKAYAKEQEAVQAEEHAKLHAQELAKTAAQPLGYGINAHAAANAAGLQPSLQDPPKPKESIGLPNGGINSKLTN